MVERTGRGTPDVPASGDEGSLGDLPPPDTLRWVYRRKAQVVEAVRAGRLSFEDACRRYNISPEEFSSWERAMDHLGARGLRVTRLKEVPRAGRPAAPQERS
jgi:hypothetical protein